MDALERQSSMADKKSWENGRKGALSVAPNAQCLSISSISAKTDHSISVRSLSLYPIGRGPKGHDTPAYVACHARPVSQPSISSSED